MSTAQRAEVREDEQFQEVREPGDQIGSDLSRFDTSESARRARAKEAGAVASRRRPRPKRQFHLSFLTAVCIVIAVGFAGLMLRACLNLTVVNDEVAKLDEQLAALRNDHIRLQTQYESRYDLGQVEEYAQNTLGMIKMERSQVEYVEIASPDSIRAPGGTASDGASASLSGLWQRFLAFIGFGDAR